ncbi:MAG: hypothetical protein ACE5H5_01595 [Nitrospinota bacterium]
MSGRKREHQSWTYAVALLAGGVLALLATSGCQRIPGAQIFSSASADQAVTAGRFRDLPVPSSFRLITDRSFIYETPNLKAGILVYKGGLSVAETVTFFKNQMPANGWRSVSSYEFKDVLMKFEKVGWTCDITVRPGFEREIIVKIGPTSDGSGPSIPLSPSS